MDEKTLKAKLDTLEMLQAERDALALDKQALIERVMTPEIKAALDEIEGEFSEKAAAVMEKITQLEIEIKAGVIEHGATVKGSGLYAVYSKGRVTWESSLLEGLMIAIPQLEKARKVGAPSVAIRLKS